MITNETIDSSAITAVSTAGIARNLVRLERIAYAASEYMVANPDDTHIPWQLAEAARPDEHAEPRWTQPGPRQDAYEALNIRSLHGVLELQQLRQMSMQAPRSDIDISQPPVADDQLTVLDRSDLIQTQARRQALERVGLVQEAKGRLIIPVGALAALHYQRADIRSATDRDLYVRADAIDASADRLRDQAAARTVTMDGFTTAAGSAQTLELSVYRAAESIALQSDAAKRLGREGLTGPAVWWQELTNDLARIDATSGSL